MSMYKENHDACKTGAIANAEIDPEFRAEYPALSEVLGGVLAPDGKTFEIWPATLMLFTEGGKLKFVISPKVGPKVAFGCLADASKGFLALEDEISLGRFEWKMRGGVRKAS